MRQHCDVPLIDVSNAHGDLTWQPDGSSEIASIPSRLANAPCWRALIKKESAATELAFEFPHALMDGWSCGVFLKEFAELYRVLAEGRAASLPALEITYGQCVAARECEAAQTNTIALDFWSKRLSKLQRPSALPHDAPVGQGCVVSSRVLILRLYSQFKPWQKRVTSR